MKVYVDELPNNCVNCDFGYANNSCYIDYEVDLRKFDKNKKHPKCPLQSLTDYTKQVRKEVVQELKEKLKPKEIFHPEDEFTLDYDFYYKEDVEEILDQIQGETK